MKLAAIDIGSNAARLLITEVQEQNDGTTTFNKINLVRVPLRLGFDVFDTGRISDEKQKMILETMTAYKHLIKAYKIKHVIACATSAMRDASNTKEVLKAIKEKTGIKIQVITGGAEAAFIYENHIAENMDKDHSYLYIDVGGGSTELTFFSNGALVFKDSYNIGTIRLLKNMVKEVAWDEMKEAVKQKIKGHKEVTAIGSGGNINKIFSLSKKKEGKPLTLDMLKDYYNELHNVSVEDRMEFYQLKEDRADVIVPAMLIYINVMKWAGASEIYVPKIGLADGLVHHLWEEIKDRN
jgi:exopolyphosphatase / guanosine-5'-triphosphate,3'-diphosphate pyrophosphatase